ncbi:MAG: dUTP diphosphatase [Deltaproteobacteria bacterium]|nr:dUTP diphosphatase [Deltaproteobacteria bacterium]MBI3294302.1 dUTP diphosphatase [Deltaproteobacteria bacterium]
MKVLITKLNARAVVPQYQSAGASGCDACACLDVPLELKPLERAAVPTGLAVAVPPGFEIQVRPRSGLAIKQGLTVVNAPGTIDSDYRGEMKILMVNLGDHPVVIEHGMRIAQLVLASVARIEWNAVDCLDTTTRGAGGFGSTGV